MKLTVKFAPPKNCKVNCSGNHPGVGGDWNSSTMVALGNGQPAPPRKGPECELCFVLRLTSRVFN